MPLNAHDLKKIRSILQQELSRERKSLSENGRSVQKAEAPICEAAMWTIQEIQERFEISRSELYRRINQWNLEKCDAQGYPKKEGDGRRTYIFSQAWVARKRIGTRKRRNALRRAGQI